MRFDNIAMAANTPGGFQAGVNDMVQALMGAKRQQAQLAFQEAQAAREQGNLDRSYGAQQAQQLAGNAFREREVASTEARTKNDAIQNGQKFTMGMMDRAGSVGQDLADRMFGKPGTAGSGGQKPMTYADQLAERKYKDDVAEKKDAAHRLAADRQAGITKGQVNYDENEPVRDPTGVQLVVEGVPQFKKTTRERNATAAEYARAENIYRGLVDPQFKTDQDSQFRGEVIPDATPAVPRQASGAAGLGSQVAESLAPNTGSTDGLSQNEAAAPAVDYEAEDLKLQALDPKYKQRRAVPGFNWKGVIDETVRRRAQPTR